MPHFFFDLHNGSVLERDEFGVDLPDFESAYLQAHRAAIEMWSEACRVGRQPPYRCFEIRDSQGRVVIELSFTEALGLERKKPASSVATSRVANELVKTEPRKTNKETSFGERQIANQRARIARLEAKGLDVSLANAVLKTFLVTQELYERYRGNVEQGIVTPAKVERARAVR